jgi:glyoxylase-like metal-dependent hydrolase (beta-lactamase superfamily II)/ferredoxin
MARLAEKLPENAPGPFFVDASCIDCETCRELAPEVFARDARRGQSIVARQPAGEHALERARLAVVACPTASIGTSDKRGLAAAARAFPIPVEGVDGVAYCGYASESSFGASSWLVQRAAGNVLVDSPRAAQPLLARLGELGGVALHFLTHSDDVADHALFHARFGAPRLIHRGDAHGELARLERILDGEEPIALDPELTAIPVPGHTAGSCALLWREQVLFTGDHLWGDEDTGELSMSRRVCWHSWPAQLASLERLLDHRFQAVLPGHGRPFRAPSAAAMRAAIEKLLVRLGRRR